MLAHRGRFYFVRALSGHKIRVRLHQNQNDINNPANAKQANGEQIQDSHADAPFIEFMCTEIPQEQAQEKCRPLIAVFSAHRSSDAHRCTGGCRCAGIIVIDNIDLLILRQLPCLFAALGADDAVGINAFPSVRAILTLYQLLSTFRAHTGIYINSRTAMRAMVYRFHDYSPPWIFADILPLYAIISFSFSLSQIKTFVF